MITPVQGRLLVKTKSAYQHLKSATEEQFGTSKTRGEVIAIASDITSAQLEKIGAKGLKVGCDVYFGKYEDTAPYKVDSEDGYILIKLEEIGGFDAKVSGS